MELKVKKSEIPTNYLCNICNKFYTSPSSLCNHNKKFHKIETNNNNSNLPQNTSILPQNTSILPQNTSINHNVKNKLECVNHIDKKNKFIYFFYLFKKLNKV